MSFRRVNSSSRAVAWRSRIICIDCHVVRTLLAMTSKSISARGIHAQHGRRLSFQRSRIPPRDRAPVRSIQIGFSANRPTLPPVVCGDYLQGQSLQVYRYCHSHSLSALGGKVGIYTNGSPRSNPPHCEAGGNLFE